MFIFPGNLLAITLVAAITQLNTMHVHNHLHRQQTFPRLPRTNRLIKFCKPLGVFCSIVPIRKPNTYTHPKTDTHPIDLRTASPPLPNRFTSWAVVGHRSAHCLACSPTPRSNIRLTTRTSRMRSATVRPIIFVCHRSLASSPAPLVARSVFVLFYNFCVYIFLAYLGAFRCLVSAVHQPHQVRSSRIWFESSSNSLHNFPCKSPGSSRRLLTQKPLCEVAMRHKVW